MILNDYLYLCRVNLLVPNQEAGGSNPPGTTT
jgi:hypothetical protein